MWKVIQSSGKKIFSRSYTSISSRYETETISYSDNFWFPPEEGHIQRSKLFDKVVIPKCRLDQYVWENFNQWQDKTALVRIALSFQY